MEYIALPDIELKISRIGFGAEPLGGTDWGYLDEGQAILAVSRACDLGINLFDTADVYGLGHSETLLSKGLGSHRHEAIIITKFGVGWRQPEVGRAETYLDSSPTRVVEALEASLYRLRIDCVPIYLVHWPDPHTPIDATLQALLECQKAGKVRYFGVSNFSLDQVSIALKTSALAVLQTEYSLVNRTAEKDLLPFCQRQSIGVLVYGSLAQGLLTGKYGTESKFSTDDRRHRLPSFQGENLRRNLEIAERVKVVSSKVNKSSAQVALRWVLDQPSVSGAIVGIKTVEQVENNSGAIGWRLSPEDRTYLERGDIHDV